MVEIKGLSEAMIKVEIKRQDKTKEKNAKKAYITNLTKQGIDQTVAKIMADTFFEYGIVKAL